MSAPIDSQNLADGAGSAGEPARLEVMVDDVGPAVLVDGVRHPTTADDLEVMGRRALAIAASLRGGLRPPGPVDVEIFRPVWPPRLPIEVGVPPELVVDPGLTGTQRFIWFALWLLVPHFTGRFIVRERLTWVAKWLNLAPQTVRRSLARFEERGWATVLYRASSPSGHGEFEALLHLQRRPPASDDGVIDATAELRG